MKKVQSRWKKSKFNRPYTQHNTIEWVQSGSGYFNRLEQLIDGAKYEIHIQTYILQPDSTGDTITEALIRASLRQVKVFLLVDAYGSNNISRQMAQRLRSSGIRFRRFGKLFYKGRFHFGRRMHHKVIVIDGFTSLVGGMNIADHYRGSESTPAWLDFAAIMQGDISRKLQVVCRRRWVGWPFSLKNDQALLKNHGLLPKSSELVKIRVRRNDFVQYKQEITLGYREAIRRAEKSILLVGGYFLPGGTSRRVLKNALSRGVKIDVVVSEKSDVKLLILARRYLYDWLIRNGIGVYEYKPANVHGKVLIVDDHWATIGSYDLNNLSAYSNIELNVDVDNAPFSQSLAAQIRKIMVEDCQQIVAERPGRRFPAPQQLLLWLSYRFVKTLFVLSLLLAGKKANEF